MAYQRVPQADDEPGADTTTSPLATDVTPVFLDDKIKVWRARQARATDFAL